MAISCVFTGQTMIFYLLSFFKKIKSLPIDYVGDYSGDYSGDIIDYNETSVYNNTIVPNNDDTNTNKDDGGIIITIFIIFCGLPILYISFKILECLVNIYNKFRLICHDCYIARKNRKIYKTTMNKKLENYSTKKKTPFGNDCSICMDDTNTKSLVSLPCKHIFHKKCINPWIKKELSDGNTPNCPLCRTDIYTSIEISKIRGNYIYNKAYITNYNSDSSNYSYDEYEY